MVEKETCTVKENLGGGKGRVLVYNIVSSEKLGKVGRMYARVVLEPGCSVGWHQHNGETEPYYIIKGHADFIDNDKSITKVGPGDICTIEDGQYHSIENNYDENMEMIALIYNL
ncbi:cupin domain-containing protein [Ileibacterium valens]|uniref:Cupin n=1 Tax=Ileibacterium valens TaxID=1862668 RepID=A0A1U7ND47_9FIRM|nr:cupin domain-containing protein [Ileibacterium valens]OLU36382.1 cupin [Erysipelotrichaceae bacterium NYU-BL-E8]OLU36808.1 cupin [Ileibacterium valens]OLU42588.1 cupin [Erysipelotrichaceae bacterium NYU-BL-F16]